MQDGVVFCRKQVEVVFSVGLERLAQLILGSMGYIIKLGVKDAGWLSFLWKAGKLCMFSRLDGQHRVSWEAWDISSTSDFDYTNEKANAHFVEHLVSHERCDECHRDL